MNSAITKEYRRSTLKAVFQARLPCWKQNYKLCYDLWQQKIQRDAHLDLCHNMGTHVGHRRAGNELLLVA